MSVKLIPPGKRRNKFWNIYGRIDGSKPFEKSTGTRIRADAEKIFRAFLVEYEQGKHFNENVTFDQATERWLEYRNPTHRDKMFLQKMRDYSAVAFNGRFGDKFCSEIVYNDFVILCNGLYPGRKASSHNRAVLTPAGSVMHYAAKNKWCPHLSIDLFSTAAVAPRFVSPDTEAKLLAATDGKKRLFLLWLFRQGDRLNDTLKVKLENCDLKERLYKRYISKSDRFDVVPLDDDICKAIADDPGVYNGGYLFHWKRNHDVYYWLNPLCQKLGVAFTPHRARHTLGKKLNDAGAGLKTIMQTLGHSDPKSSLRYQTTDIEGMRAAKARATA